MQVMGFEMISFKFAPSRNYVLIYTQWHRDGLLSGYHLSGYHILTWRAAVHTFDVSLERTSGGQHLTSINSHTHTHTQ